MLIPDEGDGLLIPEADGPTTLCVSDDDFLPVHDPAELARQFLPAYAQKGDDPLRDAVLAAVATQHNVTHAEAAMLLDAQTSPSGAWGDLLDGWGDELGRPRLPSEEDGPYRARLLEAQDAVTPEAIVTAVRRVLGARFAPKGAVFVETKQDFVFARSTSDPSTAPHCFLQTRSASSPKGRVWASGRRTGLRTAGAYLTSLGPPELWVIVPASVGSKRGCAGPLPIWVIAERKATAFVGTIAGPVAHTFLVSALDNQSMTGTTRALKERVLAGVKWTVVADPAVALSIVR